MTQPDRLLAPELRIPGITEIIKAEKFSLDNGMPLYAVNAGIQDVVRLEVIFPTASPDTTTYFRTLAAHQMLDSGTKGKDAMAIAEGFDYFGAHFETGINADWKTISLFSLTRLLPETLPLLKELLMEANYPDTEVSTWKTRHIQNLRVQQGKVSWLARTAFNASLYSNEHLYGYTPMEEDYAKVESNQVRETHARGYMPENAMLVLAGKFNGETLKAINSVFGSMRNSASPNGKSYGIEHPSSPHLPEKKIVVEKADALQSSIRIGKLLFAKSHPDYAAMTIVSTLLGGYFGSRLMTNIREDKGYTYGIGSAVVPNRYSGTFFISTEVGKDVCAAAVDEIYAEMDRLLTIPVPEEELTLVKNYLTGSFQRSIDGPFGLADRFKGLIMYDVDYEYLDRYQKLLHSINSEIIQEMAQKWLSPDSMTEVIAG